MVRKPASQPGKIDLGHKYTLNVYLTYTAQCAHTGGNYIEYDRVILRVYINTIEISNEHGGLGFD